MAREVKDYGGRKGLKRIGRKSSSRKGRKLTKAERRVIAMRNLKKAWAARRRR